MQDVREAAERLAGVAHRTPVVTSRTLNDRAGCEAYLKCENLQRVGAFKIRGAYNAISRLDQDSLARGVLAYSSGNHAQAVALSCRLLGSRAVIVMPDDAPAAKRAATEGYGAEIVTYSRAGENREELGRRLAEERGLTVIPPYDHPLVMAGQGTAALELVEETDSRDAPLDALLVPVGGGGLLAGSATAATALRPGIRVIGVEPEAADDTRRSLAAGRRVSIAPPQSIADGQTAMTTPGELTFPVVQRLAEGVVTVTDDEIRAAMVFALERLKLVLEPSGATALAALLSGRVTPLPRRAGVILTGGNVGTDRLLSLLG
ncbi:pyridoxal-phosphate dependent enzyme [Streptomyces sp. 7-21]|uniref:pyridoxal-phosphate dependent enzyme n=1 Tax=Streptomyces sp. 7-21 TaxID=2802283 RepID=UPI00191E6A30|nr:pyridoxal-phosphate dependent enzyme [Streptomyces sp. 7-21]MBL1066249.1 pyridoxal-phosphate dependent enzyme [Streptomyces sp. 7-21]